MTSVAIHRKMMNILRYCDILSQCSGINIAVNISTIYCGLCSPQQYYVQLYTHNTKYPPCKKFSCCDGFQQLLDKCIGTVLSYIEQLCACSDWCETNLWSCPFFSLDLKNFSKVVTLLADWREKNPVGELKAALANILVKEKIFG